MPVLLPLGRPRFGGPVPAELLADIADDVDAIGVPADDCEPGVEERSRSRKEVVDEERSFDGILDWEDNEGT